MNKNSQDRFFLFLLCAALLYGQVHGDVAIRTIPITEADLSVSLDFTFDRGDFVYSDYLTVSVDYPDISAYEWKPSTTPINFYDPVFKETKKVFDKPFSLAATIHAHRPPEANARLHVSYYQRSHKKIKEVVFPLTFAPFGKNEGSADTQSIQIKPQAKQKAIQPQEQKVSWSAYLSRLIEQADSMWLRILLAFVLGILLSLTPCIYPMIPITMGVLQSQGSTSLARNFLLALFYTVGIASTFALLGLTAALGGSMFGSFMNHPAAIFAIVMVLVYLSGSMIGLYDMYVPSFMQPRNSTVKGGSLLSAFAFGAVSGTVASPCLSPGLVLLLTIVTSLGNALLGFSLLFSFGIGLSMPLLVIGLFSSSLNSLPQAGMWMVEIKRFFGFMMIGICFYFLKNLLPLYLLIWLGSLVCFLIGSFYIRSGGTIASSGTAQLIKFFGSLLIITAIVLAGSGFRELFSKKTPQNTLWLHDYKAAQTFAKQENKKLLLDVSAPYCSICKAIDIKHFTDPGVVSALSALVPIKIEELDPLDPIHTELKNRHKIVGAPTFVVIDPDTQKEIKRWESDLYDLSCHEFIQQITNITS